MIQKINAVGRLHKSNALGEVVIFNVVIFKVVVDDECDDEDKLEHATNEDKLEHAIDEDKLEHDTNEDKLEHDIDEEDEDDPKDGVNTDEDAIFIYDNTKSSALIMFSLWEVMSLLSFSLSLFG